MRGTLSISKAGVVQVADCLRRKTVTVGPLRAGSYRYLRRRYQEISAAGDKPVAVEIIGFVRRTDHEWHVDKPKVLKIVPGHCRDLDNPE